MIHSYIFDYRIDHLDEETRRLHIEGCAPKPQFSIDAIKKEDDRKTAKRKNMVKNEKSERRKKVKKEKVKKLKKSKK